MADPLRVLVVTRETSDTELTHGHPEAETAPMVCSFLFDAGFDVELCNNVDRIKGANTAVPLDMWSPPDLPFDAIVFHSKNEIRDDYAVEALTEFVGQGKGLVVTHNASASFAHFDETTGNWIELIGSAYVFAFPGQTPISTFPNPGEVKVRPQEPRHPIMNGLPDEFSLPIEELFLNMRLASDGPGQPVAVGSTVVSNENGTETTIEHPVAFALEKGYGRVFHMYLGNYSSTYLIPHYQRIIRQGVEWVARRR